MDSWMVGLIIAALAALIGIGSRFIPTMGPDNPIEQSMEQIIKDRTMMDIDLSPDKK